MSINVKAKHQTGIISIFVTMIIMIVITLIVIGFAEISRIEQRNTTDDQLSVEAYYAAESGINDAVAAIDSSIASNPTTILPPKTTCQYDSNYPTLTFPPTNPSSSVIDSPHKAAYTCLLIDTTSPTLEYTIGFTSTVIPLIADNNSNNPDFGKLKLKWTPSPGATGSLGSCPSLGSFPPAGSTTWKCPYPMLRIDLLDATSGSFSRSLWQSNTSTMFLQPEPSGPITTSLPQHGSIVPANCSSGTCQVTFNGVNGKVYYMRVMAIYLPKSVLTISAVGGKLFANAQAKIDATGIAQDVLRRIAVTVDLTNANAHLIPSNAIATEDSLCKRFGVTNTSFYSGGLGMNNGDTNPINPLCQ